MVNPDFWRRKRILLTGHTGFKGGWLALWLHDLGAELTGYALAPPTSPSLFEAAKVESVLNSVIGDIRNSSTLEAAARRAKPEIIFHLAAQPLVSEGYRDPVGTFATNVTGTINLLETARRLDTLKAIIVVTSDKCYENLETPRAYQENDLLGGYDPYSSSKACTEILTHSWRRSFFNETWAPHIATARAGNVIGGGDWAENRLVPDILKAFTAGEIATLRHPEAVRPWQHVLDPLAGYIQLAEHLYADGQIAGPWNFGPDMGSCVTAGAIADQLVTLWPTPASWRPETSRMSHEAGLLRLDASKAEQKLQWRPKWPLMEGLRHTVDWQLAWQRGEDMQDFCRKQIRFYSQPRTGA